MVRARKSTLFVKDTFDSQKAKDVRKKDESFDKKNKRVQACVIKKIIDSPARRWSLNSHQQSPRFLTRKMAEKVLS